MADSAFPMKPPVELERSRKEPRRVPLQDAGEVLEILASETARAIIQAVADAPATASDLADQVDTSLQNVYYHLERMADADILEVTDHWYSSRGREMDVYALAAPLVISIGSDPATAPASPGTPPDREPAGQARPAEPEAGAR